MVKESLLDMLVCPDTREPLRQIDERLLTRLNEAVAAGHLRNVAGLQVETPLDDALIAEDGHKVFPIFDNITVLITDEAIELTEELTENQVLST